MIKFFEKLLHFAISRLRRNRIEAAVKRTIASRTHITSASFDFKLFKDKVNRYLSSMQVDAGGIHYRYSNSCTKPTLYASAYACLTLSLLGDLKTYTPEKKRDWAAYFDSFQSQDDGLFYDPAVMNDLFPDTDWWGARHLALHMINAYTALGLRPKFPFAFLKKYYKEDFIKAWIDTYDWHSHSLGSGDIDNKIMNIGCLLQYQRDYWNDSRAGDAIFFLKKYLRAKINPQTGIWGIFDTANDHQRSRMVQFAYHLLPIFFYDNDYDFKCENISKLVLCTQNKMGGYGVALNSSACEDIDSIDILIRFYPFVAEDVKADINKSLNKGFNWVLFNQVPDNGFVFRLLEPFVYGSAQTSSEVNSGALLPTWFRTLSIAYMTKHLNIDNAFIITTCPGYEIK